MLRRAVNGACMVAFALGAISPVHAPVTAWILLALWFGCNVRVTVGAAQ